MNKEMGINWIQEGNMWDQTSKLTPDISVPMLTLECRKLRTIMWILFVFKLDKRNITRKPKN